MTRIVLIGALASLFALPAAAQSLGGGIFSGMPSGLGGGFVGGVGSGFDSGLGARDGGRGARIDDFTLGANGQFRPGFLRGQPSNFAASVEAMSSLPRTTLPLGGGPEISLDLGQGPAGPMD